MHEAVATYSNGQKLVFELNEYQVEDFMMAIVERQPYKDHKTGVISWLPPENLHHIIIRPYLESPKCQESQPLDQVSDLLA